MVRDFVWESTDMKLVKEHKLPSSFGTLQHAESFEKTGKGWKEFILSSTEVERNGKTERRRAEQTGKARRDGKQEENFTVEIETAEDSRIQSKIQEQATEQSIWIETTQIVLPSLSSPAVFFSSSSTIGICNYI